jgi:hypothetical protein
MRIFQRPSTICTYASTSQIIGMASGIKPNGRKIVQVESQTPSLKKPPEKDGPLTLNSASKTIMIRNLNCSYLLHSPMAEVERYREIISSSLT